MTTVPDLSNPVQAPHFVATVQAVAQKAQGALSSGGTTLQADAQAGEFAALVCNPDWRLRREL